MRVEHHGNRADSFINLRKNFMAQLIHPVDLTKAEAERLKTWIDLLVIPAEEPKPADQPSKAIGGDGAGERQ